MANMNKVILMGNLTRDPELKDLPSGNKVCEFGLALNSTYTTQSGERKEEVTFVDLSTFGRGGEVIQQYCRKGSPLFVEGRLRYDSWTNDKGEKRNKLSVIVNNFQLLPDGNRDDASSSDSHAAPEASSERKDPDPF